MLEKENTVNKQSVYVGIPTNTDSTFECARPRNLGFSSIPNDTINDKRLISGTLDMLVYLWAKPNETKIPNLPEEDHWKIRIKDLMRRFSIGKNKAYKLLNVLKESGYVKAVFLRNPDGTLQRPGVKYLYDIYPTFMEENAVVANKKKIKKLMKTYMPVDVHPFPRNQETDNQETDNGDAYKIKNTSTKEIFSINKTDPTRKIAKKSKLEECLAKEKMEEKVKEGAGTSIPRTTISQNEPQEALLATKTNNLDAYRPQAYRAATLSAGAKNAMQTVKEKVASSVVQTSSVQTSNVQTSASNPEEKAVAWKDIHPDIIHNGTIYEKYSAAGFKPSWVRYLTREFGEEILARFWDESKLHAIEKTTVITSTAGYLYTLVKAERAKRNSETAENIICAQDRDMQENVSADCWCVLSSDR